VADAELEATVGRFAKYPPLRSMSSALRFCVIFSDTNVNNSENLQGGRLMPVETRSLERSFSYNGLRLPDPDPRLTPEQVRDLYCRQLSRNYDCRD
jgi:hypothetical protein